jgi:hypothetical protein
VEQAGDHALDIAVHDRRLATEGDGRDSRSRIGADTRQAPQPLLVIGKAPAELVAHHARAAMQVARPRVIAEPLPGMEHGVEVGLGQVTHRRPAREEIAEIGADRDDGRLLQHDLAEPHPIGIGPLTRTRAPRQDAGVPVVPGEQLAGQADGLRQTRRLRM